MDHLLELALFVFLIAIAIAIVRMRDLFAAAMLLSVFSLTCAALFTLLDAVDVAFTEAAVGAGISTILILGTLGRTSHAEGPTRHPVTALVVVSLTGLALVWATLDMPRFGDPTAPIHQHVAPVYLEDSPRTIGIPNIVTAVLASYRGYDTLGELFVIFTAGMGVALLLGRALAPPSAKVPEA